MFEKEIILFYSTHNTTDNGSDHRVIKGLTKIHLHRIFHRTPFRLVFI